VILFEIFILESPLCSGLGIAMSQWHRWPAACRRRHCHHRRRRRRRCRRRRRRETATSLDWAPRYALQIRGSDLSRQNCRPCPRQVIERWRTRTIGRFKWTETVRLYLDPCQCRFNFLREGKHAKTRYLSTAIEKARFVCLSGFFATSCICQCRDSFAIRFNFIKEVSVTIQRIHRRRLVDWSRRMLRCERSLMYKELRWKSCSFRKKVC